MDSAGWLTGAEPIVGVVCGDSQSDSDAIEQLQATLADREASIVIGTIEEVSSVEPSLSITIGESALSAVGRSGPDVPVVPIGSVPGIETVAATEIGAAIEAVLAGDVTERYHPVLGVERTTESGATDRYQALFDVTLVTAEPAQISEYSVDSRGTDVDQFRADGVVVSTPAGSYGYASGVDAPQLSAAVDAVAVTPIAPFVTTTRRWVLPHDELELGVERDDCTISLLADDRAVATITDTDRVSVGVDGTVSTLAVADSRL